MLNKIQFGFVVVCFALSFIYLLALNSESERNFGAGALGRRPGDRGHYFAEYSRPIQDDLSRK